VIAKQDVRIVNCIIGSPSTRFDIGVLLADSKNVGTHGHVVADNQINVREAAVAMSASADRRGVRGTPPSPI